MMLITEYVCGQLTLYCWLFCYSYVSLIQTKIIRTRRTQLTSCQIAETSVFANTYSNVAFFLATYSIKRPVHLYGEKLD